MAKTTNILDLNNRLEKVEKENVAQNNYNSLKNRPKINGNLLTGDKTGAQLGLAEAQDIGDLSALTTTDKSSCVGAINEVNTKIARNKYVESTMSPQATVTANTDFMTHKLVIPETGTYLVMGGIFDISVDLELVMREGESASGTVIANAWQNKCLFTVTTRNANDVLSFWMKADSEQTFYADGRGQKFFAIKLL